MPELHPGDGGSAPMAIHDAYARLTPYELFLPDGDFAGERFRAVEAEADDRGTDLHDPESFVMLMAVGETLRELKGPGDDPDRIRQHGALLYHAYHFREAGEPLFLLSAPAARYVVETGGGGSADVGPPARAGYLQLPRYLFWIGAGGDESAGGEEEGDAAAPPEAIDGLFWVAGGGRVSVLSVAGVREDRPGFSVVALPPVPLADAPEWTTTRVRPDGEDFRSGMPGAELDSLYEIRHAGELLKLLARAFRLADADAGMERAPEGAGEPGEETAGGEPVPGAGVPDATGPRPSGLPFRRITLD